MILKDSTDFSNYLNSIKNEVWEYNKDIYENEVIKRHLDEEKNNMNSFITEYKNNLKKIDNFLNKKYEEYSSRLNILNQNLQNTINKEEENKEEENNNINKNKQSKKNNSLTDSILDNKDNLNNSNDNNNLNMNYDESKEPNLIPGINKMKRTSLNDPELEKYLKQRKNSDFMHEMLFKDKSDESGFSTSWKRAYGELNNSISWLHGFCAINKTAASKILEKFKKTFISECILTEGYLAKVHLKEVKEEFENLKKLTEESEFIQKINHLVEFRKEVIKYYADNFCSGNIEKAKENLDDRLKGGISPHTPWLMFHSGITFGLIFFIIILFFIHCKYFLFYLIKLF